MLQYYATLLHASWLGRAMSGGVPWLWPISEIVHLIGMTLLLGSVGAIDLRILGVASGVPLASLRPFRLISIIGFALTLATGVGFFAGDPTQFLNNISTFGTKLLVIVLAGVNSFFFYASGLSARLRATGSGQAAPIAAKAFAAVSLVLWIMVMYLGRMLSLAGGTY